MGVSKQFTRFRTFIGKQIQLECPFLLSHINADFSDVNNKHLTMLSGEIKSSREKFLIVNGLWVYNKSIMFQKH